MGSGKLLRSAINKHGIDNFQKRVLYVFETEDEMNLMEAQIVTEEFCSRDDTYNVCPGGKGGWGYVNQNGKNIGYGISFTSESGKFYGSLNGRKNFQSAHRKGIIKYDAFRGKTHSKLSKTLMSERAKARTKEQNSQYGTMWITNGKINRKIKSSEIIPDGWFKGRKMG